MGKKEKDKVEVTLTHPIEVMSTPVTQKQWVEIMGENPSKFTKSEHSTAVNIHGKSIYMQPDHPVESMTWWSVLVFANKLSEQYGLKPAYDLSKIIWKQGTRAENGTLQVESESEGKKIKINANGGVYDPYIKDIYYQAEGFRLPTEAEQEYMLRAAGTANGIYYFGDNEAELKDHAWYIDNSDDQTHLVAELKPLIIDGKEFYDLLGNVWEWGWDWYESDYPRSHVVNPKGPEAGSSRVLRGGSWYYYAQSVRSANRGSWGPDGRYYDVGFRLVRTPK